MSKPSAASKTPLSALPSVDQLLRTEAALRLRKLVGTPRLTTLARLITDELRAEIQAEELTHVNTREALLQESVQRLESICARESRLGIRRVINATGVILHTNLGRAPLSEAARTALAREAAGYCTVEFDALSGSRARRGSRVEELLIELTGAEDALVVNNCAAAALLILRVLADGGETIVSRGELVEIGGDFRVPDVMANSGTQMVEVGTTNKTRLDDYRNAITDQTRLIMRVHPSNYRIVGFTSTPQLSELSLLAQQEHLLLFEDAGSGVLVDLGAHGLNGEPIISECIAAGADVVSFSGDKLLGACQAGLIVGRREVIGRLRKHSLYRALRADKLTLAVLEATLEAHRRGTSVDEVPALQMLALTRDEIEARAKNLTQILTQRFSDPPFRFKIENGHSAIGGGSGPNTHPETVLLSVDHATLSDDEIQARLRLAVPPVIARIADGKVLIDLRTVAPEEEGELVEAFSLLNS